MLDQSQEDIENLSFSSCSTNDDNSMSTKDEKRKLSNDANLLPSTQNHVQINYDTTIQISYPECFLCNASYNHGNHKCYIICIEGHSICKICRYKMKHNNYKACPLCRQNMFPAPGIVNREITNLLNEFKTKLKLNHGMSHGKKERWPTSSMGKSNQKIGVFGITALPYQRTWKCDECLMRNYYYSDQQSLIRTTITSSSGSSESLCCMLCGTQKKKKTSRLGGKTIMSTRSHSDHNNSTVTSRRSDSLEHDEIYMPPPAPPRRQRHANRNSNSAEDNCNDQNYDDKNYDESCTILVVSIFSWIFVYYILSYFLLVHNAL
jgi:hypothetical protein